MDFQEQREVCAEEYYLYLDDSGSRFPDRADFLIRDDGMDHFALGGVLIRKVDKKLITDTYNDFCTRWAINYPLHSSEIRSRRGNFKWLEESTKMNERFLSELEDFLLSIPVIGFAAVVHRPGYNLRYEERYGENRWLMCKTAFSIVTERVAKYVNTTGGVINIRFEEAGKIEDRALVQYMKDMKNSGMPFNSATSQMYRCMKNIDFQHIILGEPRRKKKDNLFLQIADLYLYPMAKRRYNQNYYPWIRFYEYKKVIDALLTEENIAERGIKYSCFDGFDPI